MKSNYFVQSALLVTTVAGAAFAQSSLPQPTDHATSSSNVLVGSDTLDTTIATALADMVSKSLIGASDISYLGIGSGAGQNQIEGGYAVSGEPACGPLTSSSDNNAGCQEIAPMSRMMNSKICNDGEAAGKAEMLAICKDYVVIVTDNASAQHYPAPGSTTCTTATATPGLAIPGIGAKLGGAGKVVGSYTIGDNGMEAWKDVLRLVYTGCSNTDSGTACAIAGNRVTRCSNPARAALVSNWDALFDGPTASACATGNCVNGLRRAYRRDDKSGTTSVFLTFIGVTSPSTPPARTATFGGPVLNPVPQAASNDAAYCDGGDLEGFTPDASGLMGNPSFGDPIRTACTDEEDLCGGDGKLGVVRAIRSVGENATSPTVTTTRKVIANEMAFPQRMCTPNVFRKVAIANTSAKFCPDATATQPGSPASSCWVPVDVNAPYSATSPNFNCWNRKNSVPPGRTAATFDGRAYNYMMHDYTNPKVELLANNLVDVASFREQMVRTFPAGAFVTNPTLTQGCIERDATSQIGCIVSRTTCTIGFAAEEAARAEGPNAATPALNYASSNEPFQIESTNFGVVGATPKNMQRELFLSSIGGFINTKSDCEARQGMSSPFCAAQEALVEYFRDPVNAAFACNGGKVEPITPRCIAGTVAGGPGCGTTTAGTCAAR